MIKKNERGYHMSSSHASWKEGLSMTIKEMSIKMEDESERHRLLALLACIFSIVFDILLGVAAFVCAALTDSSSGYAFAMDCALDVIAAALVLWRFYGTRSTYSDAKENVACTCLGIVFILASLGIISKSVYDLVEQSIPRQLMYVFILAGTGGIVNSILGFLKYALGKKMQSQSLILEAVNTLLSAFLALMLAFSDILFFYYPSVWTIDPVTSLLVAFLLFGCGIKVLRRKRQNSEASPLLAEGSV